MTGDDTPQRLARRLGELVRHHPENDTLKDAIALVSQIDDSTLHAQSTAWNALEAHVNELRRVGVWSPSGEDEQLLESVEKRIRGSLTGPTSRDGTVFEGAQREPERFSAVTPPLISAPFYPPIPGSTSILPIDFVELLNYTYFMHLLATDPGKVLPPGKSLLSVMSKPRSTIHTDGEGSLPKLKDHIQNVMYGAFWNDAFETLSNPFTTVQLPRIKLLYEDLYVSIKPLLPANHPLLLILTCPLSPTSSPLRSAISHLREILLCLRSRCAPVRDTQIDGIRRDIDELSPLASISDMARLVVSTVRSTLEISDLMREDLSQFAIGSMSENQLRAVLLSQVVKQEREVVFQLWRLDQVRDLWRRWLQESQPLDSRSSSDEQERSRRRVWLLRLIDALKQTTPVACPLPTELIRRDASSVEEEETPLVHPVNVLPPPLFFIRPTLLYTQNYFQALVIAATLHSLVRLPLQDHRRPTAQAEGENQENFMSRIWALLLAEVDERPDAGDTKLVNFADEVVRVRRGLNDAAETLDPAEEAKLRAAVDRTLQPSDPVFVLLQKRLLAAMAEGLTKPVETLTPASTAHLPERLQTGRDRPGKRLVLDPGAREASQGSTLTIKGFEDEILAKAAGDGLARLTTCVEWVERVWSDLVDDYSPDVLPEN